MLGESVKEKGGRVVGVATRVVGVATRRLVCVATIRREVGVAT